MGWLIKNKTELSFAGRFSAELRDLGLSPRRLNTDDHMGRRRLFRGAVRWHRFRSSQRDRPGFNQMQTSENPFSLSLSLPVSLSLSLSFFFSSLCWNWFKLSDPSPESNRGAFHSFRWNIQQFPTFTGNIENRPYHRSPIFRQHQQIKLECPKNSGLEWMVRTSGNKSNEPKCVRFN